jgi:Fe-S oxidoreductase
VGQEPSEILTLRDEFLDLVPDSELADAQRLAACSFMFEEFIVANSDRAVGLFREHHEPIAVHGHCHSKALVGMQPVMDTLALAGYIPQDLKTGCCGMAGSFGYEEHHYEMSMKIGETTVFPAVRALPDDTTICAHGFSCRHQLSDGMDRSGVHPAILLANVLRPA